ncbi:hypothetical protein ACHAXT_007633 [Thalassiosira profunda]
MLSRDSMAIAPGPSSSSLISASSSPMYIFISISAPKPMNLPTVQTNKKLWIKAASSDSRDVKLPTVWASKKAISWRRRLVNTESLTRLFIRSLALPNP